MAIKKPIKPLSRTDYNNFFNYDDLQKNLELVHVNSIKIWEKNTNKHTDEGIKKLAKLIELHGQYRPAVVWRKDKQIRIGNGMYIAIKDILKWPHIWVLWKDYLNEAEADLAGTADNQSSTWSEMDEDALRELFTRDDVIKLTGESKQRLQDFSGFDDSEFNELFRETDIDDKYNENPFPAFSSDQMKKQLTIDLSPIKTSEQIANEIMSLSLGMEEFNRLVAGKKANNCYWLSILFNPHRLDVVCKNNGKSVTEAQNNDGFIRHRARCLVEVKHLAPLGANWIKHASIGFAGVAVAQEFPPVMARDIYLKYCSDGCKVLDPCHGWGGRVVGFLAANIPNSEYYGYDPAVKTNIGVTKLIKFLKSSSVAGNAYVFCKCFEDVNLGSQKFDFAFTSPPYYDTEIYSDHKTQSCIRYSSFEEWLDKFFKILILNTMNSLKNGSSFLLNVGTNRYNLLDAAKNICNVKYDVRAISDFTIGDRYGTAGGETEPESFIIITKG